MFRQHHYRAWVYLLVSSIFIAQPLVNYAHADDIVPFTSDGCSVFPDGTLADNQLWLACCTAHDFDYWQGGTAKERLESDQRLKQCVANLGQPHIASLMLAGVRVGGSPYFPTTYRWGYGWPYPRDYQALSKQEKQQIQRVLNNQK
ncbi:hypothetical protein [Shewanella sp. ENK2]|uniref:hypothetical protein n=1 Tax=Shewanella sp. ENK2 TaxID=2775245 RepID=UPI00374A6B0D